MYKLEAIEEILRLVVWSAYLKDEPQPASALIVSKAESGKTESLKEAALLDGILMPSDATAFGILNTYAPDLMSRKIRHILLPDLITPLSKRWETSASFISFLNGLVEEGIVEVRTYAFSKKFQQPVKCGIIGCITPEQLLDKRHRWLGMGFMSRMLPVSWSYPDPIRLEILDFICERRYLKPKTWQYAFPSVDVEVNLPPDLAKDLVPLTLLFANAQQSYGFRYQKHLQRLAMASALKDGRNTVERSDIDKVIDLSKFLNLDCNPV